MTTEPQRLQYLEAMGLTAWVARYALPNARPTPACDWELPAAAPVAAPAERLHALLAESRDAPPPVAEATARPERQARPGMARALLDGEPPAEPPVQTPPEPALPAAEPASAVPEAPEAPEEEALRFAFHVGCLAGRWLIVLPGEAAPAPQALRLLANLLRAAGIAAPLPVLQPFRWPLQAELPIQAPREEAREGLRAFIEGSRRRGWAPERLLLLGRDPVLESVLGMGAAPGMEAAPVMEETDCPLLALPAWRAPALDELAASASAKRALLPHLLALGSAWQAAAEEAAGGAEGEH